MGKLNKFEDVDVLASLEAILKQNTGFWAAIQRVLWNRDKTTHKRLSHHYQHCVKNRRRRGVWC